MAHKNIPIFIPHLGCPNGCVFCDQRAISGQIEFCEADVERQLAEAVATLKDGDEAEIAFFGGSFTGIERGLMIRLLEMAQPYLALGKVSALRCSTRPDYINDEILAILAHYGVRTVELGIQSTSDEVLSASKRGHTADVSWRAAASIKAAGFNFIGQMMVGLPASNVEREIATARDICAMGADGARVYPTVVFADTELSDMSVSGAYEPLTEEDAVRRTAAVLEVFDAMRVPVIRVGLHSGESLSSPEKAVAGARHPAMGELAMGELTFCRICAEIEGFFENREKLNSGETLAIFVPKGATSRAVGQNKRNILRIREKYSAQYQINRIKIIEKSSLIGYNIMIDVL
jgi:histone acetyltransferase (RNA polymerase elongator complex component)